MSENAMHVLVSLPILPLIYFKIPFFFAFLSLTIPYIASQSFNHQGFNSSDVKLEGDAFIMDSNIQLTQPSWQQAMDYSFGRVKSSNDLHLWDKSSGHLTDFNTQFSFNINTKFELFGDGMAFFLSDPSLPFPDIAGGGLGIVDAYNRLDRALNYSFVLVEFDTFSNEWDPDGIHVGININSMRSNVTQRWFADIVNDDRYYNTTINYNSSTHTLSVSFTGYRNGTKVDQFISYQVDLRNHLPEWVHVGFSASTGYYNETHALKSWSLSSRLGSNEEEENTSPSIEKKSKSRGVLVGVGIGTSALVSCLGLAWFMLWRKRRGEKEVMFDTSNMDEEFRSGTGPRRFSYKELVRATSNFAERGKLGQGGFGEVYKGFLRDMKTSVAIKRVSKDSRQGIKEYATEVKIISQLRHRNLVQLIGWCHQKTNLLLVYEYMSNGSLDTHLFNEGSYLGWNIRYEIAKSLASALMYLQEEWEQCVLHRDIKPSNIMLDSSFNAKLGDFGLARLVDHGQGSDTTVVAGTVGYMAPECHTKGKATKKSDIFSFGVVVLEIACGRKAILQRAEESKVILVEWVWELYGKEKLLEAADPKLGGDFEVQEMRQLLTLGLWCVHPDHTQRPSIKEATNVLNFEAPLPILPEKMPFYIRRSVAASLIPSESSGGVAAETLRIDSYIR